MVPWVPLLLDLVTVIVAGNYLWILAVRRLAPEFQGRSLRVWFLGPLFSRREQFTTEGRRYRRLALTIGWIGLLVFIITVVLFR